MVAGMRSSTVLDRIRVYDSIVVYCIYEYECIGPQNHYLHTDP
jgi:hypothetical protein